MEGGGVGRGGQNRHPGTILTKKARLNLLRVCHIEKIEVKIESGLKTEHLGVPGFIQGLTEDIIMQLRIMYNLISIIDNQRYLMSAISKVIYIILLIHSS